MVEEMNSTNKELDAGDDEGGGAHDDVVVVVDDNEAVLAHGDSLEDSRWKREKDSEIPPWLAAVKSTWAAERVLFFVS